MFAASTDSMVSSCHDSFAREKQLQPSKAQRSCRTTVDAAPAVLILSRALHSSTELNCMLTAWMRNVRANAIITHSN